MSFFQAQALEVTKTSFNYYQSHRKYSVCLGKKSRPRNRQALLEPLKEVESQIPRESQNETVLQKKDVFYSLFKEVITFAILYYIFEQLPTSAEDVSWLQTVPREVF
ncbi:hypothetical protein [Candidatus Coxiella mudrowiae]|uniref:hypothetical protein n=1 Tax=Candidatus Coxiella mudrowiae TaxID=2054173 RepID=UPI000662707A|nr:hypothetical protein [Candidatus Coxiella mudrowiae]